MMKKCMPMVFLTLICVGCLWLMTPRPELLENDAPQEDSIMIPDAQVPLAEAPASSAKDPYAQFSDSQLNTLREVLDLVNDAREAAGVDALALDPALCGAAQLRSGECVSKFSHTRPDGSSYKSAISEAGVSCGYTGENAATGQSSAKQVVDSWLNSEGHRANILNSNYTRLGVGFAPNTGNHYQGYAWVQLFAD